MIGIERDYLMCSVYANGIRSPSLVSTGGLYISNRRLNNQSIARKLSSFMEKAKFRDRSFCYGSAAIVASEACK